MGALAVLFFLESPTPMLQALILSIGGGVMTYITADELIPTTHAHKHEHIVAVGLIAGFSLMLMLTSIFGL